MVTEEHFNYYLNIFFKFLISVGCIIAFLLLLDYWLPGKTATEPFTGKFVESNQRYSGRYNASAYKVFTPARTFYVEKEFFIRVQKNDLLQLTLSPLFGAVNAYQCEKYMNESETFSLRLVTGFLLPALMLLLSLIHFKFQSYPIRFLLFITFVLNAITLFILLSG